MRNFHGTNKNKRVANRNFSNREERLKTKRTLSPDISGSAVSPSPNNRISLEFDFFRVSPISSSSRETGTLDSSSTPSDPLRVHLPREETVTEVSRMEHRCFRPPICCRRTADSQSSLPSHPIPLCGNTISTRSFVCVSPWMRGVGVFETSDTRSEIPTRNSMAELDR